MSVTAHIICTTLWRVETVQSDAFVLDLSLSGLSIVFIYKYFSLVMENPKLSLNHSSTELPNMGKVWRSKDALEGGRETIPGFKMTTLCTNYNV